MPQQILEPTLERKLNINEIFLLYLNEGDGRSNSRESHFNNTLFHLAVYILTFA